MQAPALDPQPAAFPRELALVAGTVCGILAAMVVQILLARRGIELAVSSRDLIAPRGLALRAAVAWWIITACALLVGATVGTVVSRYSRPWTPLRGLRWIAGAILVFALAHVGHAAGLKASGNIGTQVAAGFVTLCAASLMALFGASFAARRARPAALEESQSSHEQAARAR